MSEVLNKAGRKYLQALKTHPLKTKAITTACIAACSQTIAQKVAGAKSLNYRRIRIAFLYGLLYHGPLGHYYHTFVDYLFNRKQDLKTNLKKVALEQALIGPWNNFVFMIYFGMILEGRSWSVVKNTIKNELLNVQMNSWKVWPIVGYINYRFIPTQFRVLFQAFAGACWAIFLNLKARRSLALKSE